jgi:hypothetical protein
MRNKSLINLFRKADRRLGAIGLGRVHEGTILIFFLFSLTKFSNLIVFG